MSLPEIPSGIKWRSELAMTYGQGGNWQHPWFVVVERGEASACCLHKTEADALRGALESLAKVESR